MLQSQGRSQLVPWCYLARALRETRTFLWQITPVTRRWATYEMAYFQPKARVPWDCFRGRSRSCQVFRRGSWDVFGPVRCGFVRGGRQTRLRRSRKRAFRPPSTTTAAARRRSRGDASSRNEAAGGRVLGPFEGWMRWSELFGFVLLSIRCKRHMRRGRRRKGSASQPRAAQERHRGPYRGVGLRTLSIGTQSCRRFGSRRPLAACGSQAIM